MFFRFLFALILIANLNHVVAAQGRKLYPADKAPGDASFLKFRRDLMGAVKRRDKNYVLNVLDPMIQNSFGGDGGIEEFKRMWKLDQPGSRLWDELGTILSMGGSFDTREGKRNFVAPYVTSMWPDDLDVFDYVAITGKDVRVRERPRLKAPVLAVLSYDVVKLAPTVSGEEEIRGDGHTWRKIITPEGKTGYVSEKYARSPVSYRAFFERKDGRWVMTALIAGD